MKKLLSAVLAAVLSFGGVAAVSASQAPGDTISRGAFVALLYQELGLTGDPQDTPFDDVTAASPYSAAIAWAERTGIVRGDGAGRFFPQDPLTREQAATIMLNFANFSGTGPSGNWQVPLSVRDLAEVSEWAHEGLMFSRINFFIGETSAAGFNPQGSVTNAEGAEWITLLLALE
ncbi:MAG: S-layer homology domain-containing protein [Defluviitaleaceae bacterium]|nr:S-layer homology domain-containing protein [Defluviitaleaceae bacterium]